MFIRETPFKIESALKSDEEALEDLEKYLNFTIFLRHTSAALYKGQGCRNTIPDLSHLVPFYSGQVENFYLLVHGQVQFYQVNTILFFIF